jgi:hypothetical protein
MNMAKTKKVKGICIPAPEDGSVIAGKQEYRVVYSIDIRAENPKQSCMEAINILSDQVNSFGCPGTFPPVFQVIDHKGHITTVDFEE